MSAEYGVFSDEGLVEGDLWTEEAAQGALAEHQADAERVGADPSVLRYAELCPDHEEQPLLGCDGCFDESAEYDAAEDVAA